MRHLYVINDVKGYFPSVIVAFALITLPTLFLQIIAKSISPPPIQIFKPIFNVHTDVAADSA